jgi:hypothetical protein
MSMAQSIADAHCPSCGYSLRGIAEHRCPECGFHYDLRAVRMLAIADAVRQSEAAAGMINCSLVAVASSLPAILTRLGLGYLALVGVMLAAGVAILFFLYRYADFELPFDIAGRFTLISALGLFYLTRWIVVVPMIGAALASAALGKIMIDGLFTGRGWPYGQLNLEPEDQRALRRLRTTAWGGLLAASTAVATAWLFV